jgi:TonB family protein
VCPMKARLTFGLGALFLGSLATRQFVAAQDATSQVPQPSVVLVKLWPLQYPPLARQARIMGEVKLDLEIHPDGSIASVKLFSGHPTLAPAAVQSGQKSTFECRQCTETIPYRLTYTFEVYDDGSCGEVVQDVPARSPRCLYLWKCGVRHVCTRPTVLPSPQEIIESPGQVRIRAPNICVETDTLYSSN